MRLLHLTENAEIIMTTQKRFVKTMGMLFCLLILVSSSYRTVLGQKKQTHDKQKGDAGDYVLTEGDIQVSSSFYQELVAASRSPQAAPIRHAINLWPGGIVPFRFQSNVDDSMKNKMRLAMETLEAIANMDFRDCEEDSNCSPFPPGVGPYVRIRSSDENSSRIGMETNTINGQYLDIGNWNIGLPDNLSALDQASASFLDPPPDWRFLDVAYDGSRGSPNGSFLRPYTSFAEAISKTPAGGTIGLLATQTIPAVGTYDKPINIRAAPGVEAILGD